MIQTATPAARRAHERYEARRRGKTITKPAGRPSVSAKAKPGTSTPKRVSGFASPPRRAAVGKVKPGVWAVTKELNALKAAGVHWLTAKQCARIFGCSNGEWLNIQSFDRVPKAAVLDSGIRRWPREELVIWAANGCPFSASSPPSPSIDQHHDKFYRRSFMPHDRVASKSLTQEIAARYRAKRQGVA